MAGVLVDAVVPDEALAAASTETILQVVAPANHPIKVTGAQVSFKGTDNTAEPIRAEVLRQSTAGTASALGLVERSITGATIQTSAQQDFTAEPTPGNILEALNIHPQAGVVYDFPFDEPIWVAGGGRLGLRVITPSGVNPNVAAKMRLEE